MLLSDSIEKKINLAFLLKDLFIQDKLFNVYDEELSNILKSINPDEIPKDYAKLIEQNLDNNLATKVKFTNYKIHNISPSN